MNSFDRRHSLSHVLFGHHVDEVCVEKRLHDRQQLRCDRGVALDGLQFGQQPVEAGVDFVEEGFGAWLHVFLACFFALRVGCFGD